MFTPDVLDGETLTIGGDGVVPLCRPRKEAFSRKRRAIGEEEGGDVLASGEMGMEGEREGGTVDGGTVDTAM